MRDLKPKGGLPITGQKQSQGPSVKATKSRNGCQRCKARRLKCDEGKPHCKRCQDKGISCPGYARDFRWSSKYEVLRPSSGPSSSQKPVEEAPPPPTPAFPGPSLSEFDPTDQKDFIVPPAGTGVDGFLDTDFPVGPLFPPSQPQQPLDDELLSQEGFGFPLQNMDFFPTPSTLDFRPPVFDPAGDLAGGFPQVPGFESDDILPAAVAPPFDEIPLENSEWEEALEEVGQQKEMALVPVSKRTRNVSSSSAHAPDDLLRWFYRMTPTQYSDTDLVEHYFSKVCRLYALFDSTKNPFRALVGHNWDSSGSIALAIQSMSCAHLANTDSAMIHKGLEKQRQARISIHNDLQLWRSGNVTADRVLLAILLLGPTVSWHNANDIGLDYLNIARELINAKLSQPRGSIDEKNRALEQFFLHAMIYWEMEIAFVNSKDDAGPSDPDALEASLQQLNLNPAGDLNTSYRETIKPHPWTGIAPHVQMLFAEVGRIMRRRINNAQGPTATEAEEKWALAIEKALKAAEIPMGEDVLDSEDQNTPENHFVQLAEAYRCAGLLQIYHVFPNVLSARLLSDNAEDDGASSTRENMEQYRTNLALHTLGLVEALPISSGTSCLHPILVLTAGSELRYSANVSITDCIDLQADQPIAVGRDFAEKRLSELASRLPQKPYLRMIDIMKETWLQMDMFGTEVHWMQVMYEKGWETIMG